MNTEELLKEAFERQAERAPDHHRVLRQVNARVSAQPRMRVGRASVLAAGVVAAVAAVAAVVVPVALVDSAGSGEANQVEVPTLSQPPAGPTLKYRPTWLPDGLVESHRLIDTSNGMMVQTWSAGQGPTATTVSMSVFKESELIKPEQLLGPNWKVDINGAAGLAIDWGYKTTVEWIAAPNEKIRVEVSNIPDASDAAIRVAQSVKSGEAIPFAPALEFGWLPGGDLHGVCQVEDYGSTGVIVSLHNTGSNALRVRVSKNRLGATVGDRVDNSQTVTVRGMTGSFVGNDEEGSIEVQLDTGHWLIIGGVTVGRSDLIKIADNLQIRDLSFPWLGKR